MLVRKLSLSCLVAASVAAALSGCATATTKEKISTAEAPAAIGPYSQAIRAGNAIYLSGQIPLDPKTGQVNAGSIEEQTTQVLENLKAVLAASSMDMGNVVSTTVYMKDLNDFSKMNAVYARYFDGNHPARATVQVARLPRDASIEISAIAVK